MTPSVHKNLADRFNVNVFGEGATTLLLVHGFGCNQAMWVLLIEQLQRRIQPQTPHIATVATPATQKSQGQFRFVLMDLMGCGAADSSAYDATRYASLDGYVDDVLEVAASLKQDGGRLVLVCHSVGAAICLAASLKAPELAAAQVLVAPSPCFLNDGDYPGGFEREHIDTIIETMHSNRRLWAENFSTLVVGGTTRPQLADEFVESYCSTYEPAAIQFALLTFLVDQRADLAGVSIPTLLLQALHDPLASVAVGEFMHRQIAQSVLSLIDDTGHSPHLTAPDQCALSIGNFLASLDSEPI